MNDKQDIESLEEAMLAAGEAGDYAEAERLKKKINRLKERQAKNPTPAPGRKHQAVRGRSPRSKGRRAGRCGGSGQEEAHDRGGRLHRSRDRLRRGVGLDVRKVIGRTEPRSRETWSRPSLRRATFPRARFSPMPIWRSAAFRATSPLPTRPANLRT